MLAKTLNRRADELSRAIRQREILTQIAEDNPDVPFFSDKLLQAGYLTLKPTENQILQLNLGKMCNQVCAHCHVDAGPDRKEIMLRETIDQALVVLQQGGFKTLDLTGGAPELNPNFRYLVEQVTSLNLGVKIMVRCNLTIILANKKYHDLPQFFAKHKVNVVSSLPFYNADKTDKQRGTGVFQQSIEALQMLNAVGYGMPDSGLELDLVYNPSGAFLPDSQQSLKARFQKVLLEDFNVVFNELFAITNMPISRYLEYLLKTDNFETYLEKLADAFNPAAVDGLMCKTTLSVGWDGYLYDCDFNQMLEMKIDVPGNTHIKDFDPQRVLDRTIAVSQHCFGCTAGNGSSCGGAVV